MLVNVRLVGDMAEAFGANHLFEVSSAREVFSALAANFADFRAYLLGSEDRGVEYRVLVDEVPLDLDELKRAAAPTALVVAPIAIGSGGAGKIIAGIGLLILSAFVPFSIGLLGAGVISSASIGLGLLLSGASQLLSEGSKKDSNNPSGTAIGGNGTITDGEVIPICYGRVFVKGRVISAGTTVNKR
jgi:predicted phage tail protein